VRSIQGGDGGYPGCQHNDYDLLVKVIAIRYFSYTLRRHNGMSRFSQRLEIDILEALKATSTKVPSGFLVFRFKMNQFGVDILLYSI
jgi:hypothetical protein